MKRSIDRARPRPCGWTRMWGVLVVAAAGCSSSTSVPDDAPPSLSNFVYEVEELNVESCPTTDSGEPRPSTVIRWSIDYTDVNGDVEPPFLMLWQAQFQPLNLPPETALLTIRDDAITQGDGAAGTVSLRQCVKFVDQDTMRLWIWVLDRAGKWSDLAFLEIERPQGAPAPPWAGAAPDAGGLGHLESDERESPSFAPPASVP